MLFCQDSIAVMACAKNCSDQFTRIWMRAKCNFHRIDLWWKIMSKMGPWLFLCAVTVISPITLGLEVPIMDWEKFCKSDIVKWYCKLHWFIKIKIVLIIQGVNFTCTYFGTKSCLSLKTAASQMKRCVIKKNKPVPFWASVILIK